MQSSEDGSSRIRVAARARPLFEEPKEHCVFIDSNDPSVHVKNHKFHLDYAFDEDSAQCDIYNQSVKLLVNKVLEGFNATVFAYGQTGSGKTFTMGTGDVVSDQQFHGIIPRVMQDVLCHAEQNNDIKVQISFIEIYNEVVKDLLHPSTPSSQFFVYESGNGQVTLSGVQMEPINSFQEGLRYLELGIYNRKTSTTLLNTRSSRSHCIFTLYLFKEEVLYSKFHLVDLAGSERCQRTCSNISGMREASNINKSLLVLTKVISSLATQSKKTSKRNSVFVPYRDSKLTRLLKDSLGGECLTLMVVCISPSAEDYIETLNSLRYAVGARGIKNKPQIQRVNIVKKNCREAKRQKNIDTKRMVIKGPPVNPVRKYVPKQKDNHKNSRNQVKNSCESVLEIEKTKNQPLASLSLDQLRRLKREVNRSCISDNSRHNKSARELKGEVQRLQQAFSKLEGETSKSLRRGQSMSNLNQGKQPTIHSKQNSQKPGSAPSKQHRTNKNYHNNNNNNNVTVKQQFVEYRKKIKNLENGIKKIKSDKKALENTLKQEKRKNKRVEAEKAHIERQMSKLKSKHKEKITTLEQQNIRLRKQVNEQSNRICSLSRQLCDQQQKEQDYQEKVESPSNSSSRWFSGWKTPKLKRVQCKVAASTMPIPTSS